MNKMGRKIKINEMEEIRISSVKWKNGKIAIKLNKYKISSEKWKKEINTTKGKMFKKAENITESRKKFRKDEEICLGKINWILKKEVCKWLDKENDANKIKQRKNITNKRNRRNKE